MEATLTNAPFLDPGAPLETRVEDLLGRLTLAEKVALMAGSAPFAMHGVERLGVPTVRVTDGPTGVRSQEGETATVFPVGVAMAATWNPDLAREVAAAIAREALALNNRVVLAPTLNIVRTPLWGRNFETSSEDPFLAGVLGGAFIDGLQGEGVGASLKHYAVNNQEVGRMTLSAEVDERTLREIYLAGFEMAVKSASPWTVMASYNRVGGTYATEHAHLLNDILKGEWGYDGVVVSDWGAVHATVAAACGGTDLEMPGPATWYGDRLLAAVREGAAPDYRIDDAARRIIRLILRTGVLDGTAPPAGELRTPRHRAIAARAAEEAVVLLKNAGDLLPLDPASLRTLAVIGPNAAATPIQGGGSSRVRPGRRPSILQAITDLVGASIQILHADGEPAALAARADAVIVVIGSAPRSESEGYDRESLDLPGDQNALVEAVLAANPRTVVVLTNGAPYALPWIDHAPAVVEAWLGGEEGPGALARILFGEAQPSGRLPVTFPRRLEDTPAHAYYPGGDTVVYGEGLFVGYRHFDRAAAPPLFPFGHGLTYTAFVYADLVAPERVKGGAPVELAFTLTNAGLRPGQETAQLYVRPRGPSVERPVKELKGFAKVALAPGERREVRLTLDARAFSFWDPARHAWIAEPGAYDLLICASAADIELQATVRLEP